MAALPIRTTAARETGQLTRIPFPGGKPRLQGKPSNRPWKDGRREPCFQRSGKESITMRRLILIAAAAAMTVQPMTSLPRPVKKTGRDQAVNVVRRIATTGCAVNAGQAPVGVWHPPMVPSGNRRSPGEVRSRTGRVHDRCLPRRECFIDEGPARAGRVSDSVFRTPTLIGR